jgi:acetolactate synthase regulatory subunit
MGQYCRKLWILLLLSMSVSVSHAATQLPCPWLNAATAAGVLEGPVVVSVTFLHQDNDDAACEFTHKADHTVRTLRIQVSSMKDVPHDFPQYLAKCGQDSKPVQAIGNEAIVCSISAKSKKEVDEQVVSRVRDRAFIVNVLSNGSASEHDAMRDKAQRVAEQVAGFLF